MVLFWLVVAVIAAIGEVVTTGLFLACVAAAAAVMAVLAVVLPDFTFPLQVLGFAGLSVVGIAAIRPLIVRGLGLDALVAHSGEISQPRMSGRRAVVVQRVDGHAGQIRIGVSEFWSAKSFDGDEVIEPGQTVEIMLIDGLTALVTKVPDTAALPTETTVSPKGEV
jgi:membrane protein implicated in regulation of membrane protease activity